jgi:hypothetical protein
LQKLFSRDIAVTEMFQYPTIGSLSQFLGKIDDGGASFQSSQDRAQMRRESARRQAERRTKRSTGITL